MSEASVHPAIQAAKGHIDGPVAAALDESSLAPLPVADKPFCKANYRHMKALLEPRVGEYRFQHSLGVAKSAKKIARLYGYDQDKARMAGILHDWDKGLTFDEVRHRAAEFDLDADELVIGKMPWLLHGPTAAAALSRLYPEFGQDVFQAIARHTSGAIDMTPLDCIIYVADMVEPNRKYGDLKALKRLRHMVGEVPLEELYFRAFKVTLSHLVESDRLLFPGTDDIWNSLMQKYGRVKDMDL